MRAPGTEETLASVARSDLARREPRAEQFGDAYTDRTEERRPAAVAVVRAVVAPRQPPQGLRLALRERSALRQAVILSEILGAPRALHDRW
ncbi:MAG: hypothetical protein DCC58_08335 [Chloroflexi bacterium]|nr:MAG: hypothetical protein DCC58_08335 [Chloroflexota bacterium]